VVAPTAVTVMVVPGQGVMFDATTLTFGVAPMVMFLDAVF
jgi:hypothetical protein